MTAVIVELEQKNEDKAQDIVKLEGEKEGLQRQNEAIGILQAQVRFSYYIIQSAVIEVPLRN